jgi:hypothetical protein
LALAIEPIALQALDGPPGDTLAGLRPAIEPTVLQALDGRERASQFGYNALSMRPLRQRLEVAKELADDCRNDILYSLVPKDTHIEDCVTARLRTLDNAIRRAGETIRILRMAEA